MKKLIIIVTAFIFSIILVSCTDKKGEEILYQEKTLDVQFNGSEFMYIDSLFSLELFNTEINSVGLLEYDEDFFTLKALVIFTYKITSSEKDIKTKSIKLNEWMGYNMLNTNRIDMLK